MNQKFLKYNSFLCLVLLLLVVSSCQKDDTSLAPEELKVALRSVGNQLLISQNDTTSVVLPVVQKDANLYEISFEEPLSFDPADLNTILSAAIEKSNLPSDYLAEVLKCDDREVAYSFKIANETEKNIIPCGGRIIPEGCYTIQVKFTASAVASTNATLFYVLVFLVLAFLGFVFYSKYHVYHSEKGTVTGTSLGHFSFYQDQSKLVKEAQEIPLTQKECELLAIFIENVNQIVKREELTKRVWEDNGVIVGRSLDTYISKLRKKLEGDDSIKISNIHGVGYKLEINTAF